jgi:hypothetical protein
VRFSLRPFGQHQFDDTGISSAIPSTTSAKPLIKFNNVGFEIELLLFFHIV